MRLQASLALRRIRRTVIRPARGAWTNVRRSCGGWQPEPPTFVGVGVQRAGTSWWNRVLDHHPEVQDLGPFTKERHYFDRFWTGQFGDDEIKAYHMSFARPEGKACGEWTPRYMFDPWTPPLLRRAAPDAKVLVLLRDPVDRMLSGVTHAAERGHTVDAAVISTAIQRGFYHQQMCHLLRSFPREQVLVQLLEECVADPSAQIRRTLRFLGLAEDVDLDAALAKQVNRQKGPTVHLAPELLDAAVACFKPDVHRLAAEFPEVNIALWTRFALST